jgi:hypothetical protein
LFEAISGFIEQYQIEHIFFSEIVDQFNEEDMFNLILFDKSTYRFKQSMVNANENNKAECERFISSINADGGTNIGDGLKVGMEEIESSENRVPIMIFLTDGLPTSGEESTAVLRSNLKSDNTYGAVVHTFGYGEDHDSEFLKAIALEHEGEYRFIREDRDAKQLLKDHYSSVANPILKDLKFNYSSNAKDIIREDVAVLFEGSEVVILGRYDVTDAELEMQLDATFQAGEISFEETYSLAQDHIDDMIPRLWAHSKIMDLLDHTTIFGENDDIRTEIVELAMEFSFVTPFTSFLLTIDGAEGVTAPSEEVHEENEDVYPQVDQTALSGGSYPDTYPGVASYADTDKSYSHPGPYDGYDSYDGANYPMGEPAAEESLSAPFLLIGPILFFFGLIAIVVVVVIVIFIVTARRKSRKESISEDTEH